MTCFCLEAVFTNSILIVESTAPYSTLSLKYWSPISIYLIQSIRHRTPEEKMTSNETRKKTLLELACKLKCQSCVQKVQSTLSSMSDVNILDINLAKQSVLVEVTLPSSREKSSSDKMRENHQEQEQMDKTGSIINEIQSKLEIEAGIVTVIKGIGENAAAVVELMPPLESSFMSSTPSHVMGVIRLAQMPESDCYIDGVIGNLHSWAAKMSNHIKSQLKVGEAQQGKHESENSSPQADGQVTSVDCSVNIHEYGDLSGEDFANIGPIMKPLFKCSVPTSAVKEDGNESEEANASSSKTSDQSSWPKCAQVSFKSVVGATDVSTLIGRSIAVMAKVCISSNCSNRILSAGIIARASPVGFNEKRICDCSGKSLWEERSESKQATY